MLVLGLGEEPKAKLARNGGLRGKRKTNFLGARASQAKERKPRYANIRELNPLSQHSGVLIWPVSLSRRPHSTQKVKIKS